MQQQKEDRRDGIKSFLWSGCLTIVYFAVLFYCFRPHYAINDDMMMESILSGSYLRPYPYTYYLSAELGLFLSGLYGVLPQIPWLGLFDLFCNGICFWAILQLLFSKIKIDYPKIFPVFLMTGLGFTALCLQSFVLVHYTCLAAILGATGILLLLLGQRKNERMAAIAFFLLAYLIRENIFFLLAPMIGIVFLFLMMRERDRDKVTKRKKITREFAAFALLFCMLFLGNRCALKGEAWKDYLAYNQLRTQVYDYYGVSTTSNALEYYQEHSLTEDELSLIKAYDIALLQGENGDQKGLATVAAYGSIINQENIPGLWSLIKLYLRRLLLQREDAPWNYLVLVLYAICSVSLFWQGLLKKDQWKKVLRDMMPLGMLFIYRSLAWMYLLQGGRYPKRVTLSLYWMELAFLIGFSFILLWKSETKKVFYVYLLSLGVFFSFASVKSIQETTELYQANAQVNRDDELMMTYMARHRDSFYLLDVYTVVYRTKPVLERETLASGKVVAGEGRENYLWLGGWMIRHPLYLEKLGSELEGADNARDLLLGRKDCFLVLKENAGASREELERALSVSLEEIDRIQGMSCEFVIYEANQLPE